MNKLAVRALLTGLTLTLLSLSVPPPVVIRASTPAAQAPFQFIDETTQPGSDFSNSPGPNPWLKTATADWMGKLPDSTSLHQMSIPGTHDTCALFSGQTQTWSVTTQLEAGIRFLDIRTRRTTGGGARALAIHHEAFFQNIWLSDVLNEIREFLRKHPREGIIMRVKGDEHRAEGGSPSYEAIWPWYVAAYGDIIANMNDGLPTLGELRGKVYVLDDGANFPNHGAAWNNSSILLQDKYTVWALYHEWESGDHVSLATKKRLIREHINKAAQPANPYWVFNHLSGSGAMPPADVARATNRAAYDHIGPYSGKVTVGTVIMDYPGDRLIYRIVKSNFRPVRVRRGLN